MYLLYYRRTPTTSSSTKNLLRGYEDLGVSVLENTHAAKRCRYLNPNSTVLCPVLLYLSVIN